jgi:DNA-3-methyladenine glycosylase II
MTELAEPWRPHRTRACLYLWRSLDNAPNVQPATGR